MCGMRKPPFEITDCCKRVVCGDRDNYATFSYGRSSCARNHDRDSACAFPHNEGQGGSWKECSSCKDNFGPYDWGTRGSNPGNLATCSSRRCSPAHTTHTW
ncbi:hypothetical protein ABPG75_008278 [Micractinium tetrahymenae]